MKRSVWVHQWNQCSERTAAEFADTLLPRGISAIYIKAMDGPYWMGDVYSHPLVPTDAARMAVVCDQFEAAGLTLVPWVVPRRAANEAHVHLDCATAANGRLIIDWEYRYAGFWEGSLQQAQEYHDTLQAGVQAGVWVASAPDPRQVGRDYDPSLLGGLSAYLPQTYWTDFQRPSLAVLNDAHAAMAGLGPFQPILPFNSTPSDMADALDWCVANSIDSVSMWLMGHANAAQLDAFAQRVPGEDGEPEEPEVTDEERQQMQEKIDGLVNALGYVAGDALKPLTRKTAAKYVQTYVAETRRVAEQVGVGHA